MIPDFTSIFNVDAATTRQKPAKKIPHTTKPAGKFNITFDVDSAVSGHRAKTVKETGPKFARETFWDKYTKETLKNLRDKYGLELVNFYMSEKTLEEMERRFDMK